MDESKTYYVIAMGNAFDGLTLYGPFDDKDFALEWAGESDGGMPWEIVTLASI